MMGGNSGIGASKRRAGGVATPSVPDARDVVDQVQGLEGPSHDDVGKDGVPDRLEFALDFTDARGHRWDGQFETHILSINERAQVGLAKSRLAGGIPISSLDGETGLILEMQAHLAVALTKWPPWADELGKLRNVNLLGAIYEEVVKHEDRFWLTGAPKPSGSADS